MTKRGIIIANDDICPRCWRPWNYVNDSCSMHRLYKRPPILNGTVSIEEVDNDPDVIRAIKRWLVIVALIILVLSAISLLPGCSAGKLVRTMQGDVYMYEYGPQADPIHEKPTTYNMQKWDYWAL